MAFHSRNSISTADLKFYVDALNTKSYVSGSTSVSDIVGDSTGGTLVNGITFDENNWVFDGVADYIDFGDYDFNGSNTNFTIDMWMRPDFGGLSGRLVAFGRTDLSSVQPYLAVLVGADTTEILLALRDRPADNRSWVIVPEDYEDKWINVVWTKVPGTTSAGRYGCKGYVNGIELPTTFNKDEPGDGVDFWIDEVGFAGLDKTVMGSFFRASNDNFFKGNISSTKIYNRALTSDEVLQNYNATKWRFK